MSTPTDIPTPRTDAHSALRDPASGHEHGKTVPTDFARQLERELHEANDEIMATDDLAYKLTKDEGEDPAHLLLGRHIEKLTQELAQATAKLERTEQRITNLRQARDKDGREYVMMVEKRNASESARLAAEASCAEKDAVLRTIKIQWTFDKNQQHTHSWHNWADCQPFIERALSPTAGQGWLSPEEAYTLRVENNLAISRYIVLQDAYKAAVKEGP